MIEGEVVLEPGQENDVEEALESLNKIKENQGTKALANYIYNKGHILNQTAVGEMLGVADLLEKYVDLFTFKNEKGVFDTEHFFNEMKNFFDNLKLPAQELRRENIIRAFAEKYYKDNEHASRIPSSEELINLADGVLRLNDDFNNPSKGKKMTEKEFVDKFKQPPTTLFFSKKIDDKILKKIYAQVKAKPIPPKIDDMIDSIKDKISSLHELEDIGIKRQMQAADQSRQQPVALKNALSYLKLSIVGSLQPSISNVHKNTKSLRALSKDIDLLISENNKRFRIDDKILGLKEIIEEGYQKLEEKLEKRDDHSSRGRYLPSMKNTIVDKNIIVEDLRAFVNLLDKAKKEDPYALQLALSSLETYLQTKLDRGLDKKDRSILTKTFQKLRTEIAPMIHENNRKIEILEKKNKYKNKIGIAT